jgi:hypothetical protein
VFFAVGVDARDQNLLQMGALIKGVSQGYFSSILVKAGPSSLTWNLNLAFVN